MLVYKKPDKSRPPRGANDNVRVESNTGAWYEEPGLYRGDGSRLDEESRRDPRGMSIVAIAIVASLLIAVICLVRP